MFDVVALGETLIDFTPGGANAQGAQLFACNPGGAPANVLAMNARLGGKTAFIGKVGKDNFGDFLRNTMRQSGIDTAGLVADEKLHTTLAFVHLDEKGDRSFTFYRDLGADVMLQSHEVRRDIIDDCRIFHFGAVSLTADPCRTATMEAARYAKAQGKLISFDPNFRPLLWGDPTLAAIWTRRGVQLADLLKVSEEELHLITGTADPQTGAEKLLAMGPSLVLVSMGEKGAYYRNRVCSGMVPAFAVNTVDTTGAGDAFLGAVHYQLRGKTAAELAQLPGEQLHEIVRFANAAGSLATTAGGAIPAMPTLQAIEECLRENKLLQA